MWYYWGFILPYIQFPYVFTALRECWYSFYHKARHTVFPEPPYHFLHSQNHRDIVFTHTNTVCACQQQNIPLSCFANQHNTMLGKGAKKKCELLPKGGGGDPKVHNFEILNFGKFQVSKWASGMKRLFKVSFKNWKKVFLVEKKNWQKWFRKKFTFRGGRGGSKANLEKVYILNFFF